MAPFNQNHIIKDEISIVVHIDEDQDGQNKKRIESQLLKLVGIQGV